MRLSADLRCGIRVATLVALATLFAVRHAAADVVLTGDINELINLGINAGFELPALARGDGESTSTRNIGPGWTHNHLGGITSNFGVADPSIAHYNNNVPGATPLPAPFEQLQIGFINLDAYSQGEIVSAPIGTLQSGQTYTLKVAVGGRNTLTWPDLFYRVGLRASDGTDLGAFATATIDPGGSAAAPNPTTIQELTYTLNASSVPGHVGDPVSIVIGGYNTALIDGVQSIAFSQANFDNVRLTGVLGDLASDEPLITINRATGAVTLSKTGTTNMNITGYSLKSAAGTFNAANWLSVSNNYDKNSAPTPGDGSVDNNDAWTILGLAGSAGNLSEAGLESGGDGGVLSHTSPINLGNAWLQTPLEDVVAKVSLTNGTEIDAVVEYTGTAIPSGDLTGDTNITGADWTAFKNGQGTDFSSLSDAEAYLKGDLNTDGTHDLRDFLLFRTAYEANNGAGSFAALVGVPEPSTWIILITAVVAGAIAFGRRASRQLAVLLLGIVTMFAWTAPVQAQLPDRIAYWSFDTATLTTDGSGNIIGAADATGNHNATVLSTGLGGADGMTNISAPFAGSDSVPGQFGQGLRFNGDNFMAFPNLTELMQAAGGPSFSVSMWVQWLNTTTAPGGGTPFATLGDWGNAAAGSGVAGESSRFTYAFGPNAAGSIRSQVRRNNDANGNGDDIWAVTEVVPTPVNDGSWHMLTWTMDTTSGVLNAYYDGAFVDFTQSGDPSFAMANSTSAFGTLGLKGDSSGFLTADTRLDDVVVFGGILDQDQITTLFQNSIGPQTLLTLRVDPVSGRVQLRNDDDGNETNDPIAFNSYRITSEGNSLDASGWTPIASQTISGFPQGNGTGNGWESGPGSDENELTEWYLLGDSTLNKGQSVDLGFAYNEAVNAQDLAVRFLMPDGSLRSAKVIYAPIGGVPGDYNGNGTVDAADYTIWRDHLGQTFQLDNEGAGQSPGEVTVEDYNFWKANFGASGAGGGSSAASQSAVPEPSSAMLSALAGLALLGCVSLRRRQLLVLSVVHAQAIAGGLVLLLALNFANSASATVTVDALMQFGDGAGENGADNAAVGSNSSTGATFDDVGPSGSFRDLLPLSNGGAGLPVYEDLSTLTTGPNGVSRSGLGILFDGTDDYLSGNALAFPPTTVGTINRASTPQGTLNYNGLGAKGFQLWVYPHSGATAAQHLVMDTEEFGLRINAAGEWAMVFNEAEIDSNVPVVFNQWAHAMVVIPEQVSPYKSVLYVDGVAIASRQSNYSTDSDVTQEALVVGANTNDINTNGTPGTPAAAGAANFFRGVLDNLDMFVWGQQFEPTTGTFTDMGTFNLGQDNDYVGSHWSGMLGDIAGGAGGNVGNGSVNQADVDALVAGWLNQKLVNNIQVGDLQTLAAGDLNFDGITDLTDVNLMISILPGAGGGSLDTSALFALAGGVPEPGTWLLALLAGSAWIGGARRRRQTAD